MRYDAQTRTLHLGRTDCRCEDGTQNYVGPCPRCDGTGNGPRGGARGCKGCYGSGRKVDPTRTMPCTRCGGDFKDHDEENWTDRVPSEIVQALPHFIVKSRHRQTFVEAYIGVGLWSCTDYGRRWEALEAPDATGDDLIAEVIAEETFVQACKVARKTDDPRVLSLCDAIVIQVHPNGYNVVPFYGDLAPLTGEEVQ